MKAVLLDLDQTLADTSPVEPFRRRRAWRQAKTGLATCRRYPGVRIMLRALAKQYRLGIVTTSPRAYAEEAVERFDLGLPVLVAYHDTSRHKPHPEPLLKAVQLLGIEPSEAAYVGEAPEDIIAAQTGGLVAIAALWGTDDADALIRLRPSFAVKFPSELPGVLGVS